MQKKAYLILFTIYLISTVIFYAPFVIKNRFSIVERNWDGPAYIVVAKTFYQQDLFKKENFIHKYIPDPKQFAEKFPLYSLLIRVFSFMSYEKAMIFVSFLFGYLTIAAFYLLLKTLKINSPLLLASIFIFFPPRWFVMTKVGSAEPVFSFFSLFSIALFRKKHYFVSAILLTLATLAKINTLLIFFSYLLIFLILRRQEFKKLIYYFLPIVGILALFSYYGFVYGDFFAFFHSNSYCYESLGLFKPLFSVFDSSACYVGSIHLEEIFLFYGFSYLAILLLLKEKKWELLLFFIPSFIPMLFLQHNDFTRHGIFLYFMFGLIFSKFIVRKELLIMFLFLLPEVYLYARNFINFNAYIP